jgi:hypothetical protein
MFDGRLQPLTPMALAGLGLLLLCWAFLHQLRVYYRLRHFPGPFVARFTNLQRVFWVQTARSHEIHMQMHNRYGDFVRMGPNMISISDPKLILVVYPIRPGVPKVRYVNNYRVVTMLMYSLSTSTGQLLSNTDALLAPGLGVATCF